MHPASAATATTIMSEPRIIDIIAISPFRPLIFPMTPSWQPPLTAALHAPYVFVALAPPGGTLGVGQLKGDDLARVPIEVGDVHIGQTQVVDGLGVRERVAVEQVAVANGF